jgi:acetate kinase
MWILALNAGSASLKFALFKGNDKSALEKRIVGSVTAFGDSAKISVVGNDGRATVKAIFARDASEAVEAVISDLRTQSPHALADASALAVAYRIVHGGDRFGRSAGLCDNVLAEIAALAPLAPLHQQLAVSVIGAARTCLFPGIQEVVVFDTGFFLDLPEPARLYALPHDISRRFSIRRYGFHGLAHESLFQGFCSASGHDPSHARVITFQLGQGASVCAIAGGEPQEISMGFTPLEGLVMGTRSGDLDAGVVLHLLRSGIALEELDEILNRQSGLWGLADTSDMSEILARLHLDGRARLAADVFCHRARKYLGAYFAVLGRVDGIVFGGGIGENAAPIREAICRDLDLLGIRLDPAANFDPQRTGGRISDPSSSVQLFVLRPDEESLMARETLACLQLSQGSGVH